MQSARAPDDMQWPKLSSKYLYKKVVPKLVLTLSRLAMPSIGIPTKHMYFVVHYLSNQQLQTSVFQIDLKLQLVL